MRPVNSTFFQEQMVVIVDIIMYMINNDPLSGIYSGMEGEESSQ